MSLPLPQSDPCHFCEVLAGRAVRWSVIEQTDDLAILLNGRQFEEGQCLVVPARHAPTILDMEEQELAAIMAAARRVSAALVAAYEPEGILVYQNNGVGSGQEVAHFHLHIVPRRRNSDWGAGPPQFAGLEGGPRPASRDHEEVTAEKRQAAERLRRQLAG